MSAKKHGTAKKPARPASSANRSPAVGPGAADRPAPQPQGPDQKPSQPISKVEIIITFALTVFMLLMVANWFFR
ncbi:MAG: hypothetical protein HC884_19125 [Chloroflexaceae bacterium]|nr:hypothetical protein [Chloroflexaceae bacterium]